MLVHEKEDHRTPSMKHLIHLIDHSTDKKLIQLRTAIFPEKIEEKDFTPEAYQAILSREAMSQEEQLQHLNQNQVIERDQTRKIIHSLYQKMMPVQSIYNLTFTCRDIAEVKTYAPHPNITPNTPDHLIILLPTVGIHPDVNILKFIDTLFFSSLFFSLYSYPLLLLSFFLILF